MRRLLVILRRHSQQMLPHRMVDSINRGGATARLPNTLLLRQATREPKYALYWYIAFFILFVPIYFVNWAIAEVATWFGCVLLWGSLFWTLGVKVAAAIVFPGSLRMTSRRFERSIAIELKRRVDDIVKEAIVQSKNPSRFFQSGALGGGNTLSQLTQSTQEYVRRRNLKGKAPVFLQAMQQFVHAVEKWKEDAKNPENGLLIQSTGNALLAETQTIVDGRANVSKKKNGKIEPLNQDSLSETSSVEDAEDEHDSDNNESDDDDNGTEHEDNHEHEDTVEVVDEESGRISSSSRNIRKPEKNMWKTLWNAIRTQVNIYLECRGQFPGLYSFDWARVHMEIFLSGESKLLDSHGYKIDVCVFPPTVFLPNQSEKRVVIMCNPNAARYEQYCLHPFWLQFYRTRGNFVCIWNYRGYGRSEGNPSPQALRQDIDTIIDYLSTDLKCTRFLFHGESIGGIAACHAAATCGEQSLLIADRTFASLERVASALVSEYAAKLLYIVTGWDSNNVDGFLSNVTDKNRLILQDVNDEIVKHRSSLKLGVAASFSSTRNVFSMDDIERFLLAFERLAISTSRPLFSVQTDPIESSTGEKIVCPPFEMASQLEVIRQLVRYVVELGKGQTPWVLGVVLLEELESRRHQAQFNQTKLGRACKLFANVNVSRIRPFASKRARTLQNQHLVYDWFATMYTFAASNETSLIDSMDRSIQAIQRITDPVGFKDPYAQHVKTVIEVLSRFVNALRTRDEANSVLSGTLVSLNCGHNGSPSRNDLAKVEAFLAKSGFNLVPQIPSTGAAAISAT